MFRRIRSTRYVPVPLLVAAALVLAGLACSNFNFTFGEETAPPATEPPAADTQRATLPPVQVTQAPGQSDESVLTVVNQSSNQVCFMRISPTTSSEWGEDWLGSDILGAGDSYTFAPVAAGMYDLRAEFCGGGSVEEFGFSLMSDATWTVTSEAGPGPGPQGGEIQLLLINQSSDDVCFVYISPVTSQYWGEDWLGADIVPAGTQYTFDVPAGQYDLRAEFCGNADPVQEWAVDLTTSRTWTISPGSGGSPGGGSGTGTGLDYSLPPNYGEVTLASGFTPDPASVSITSGGPVNVATLGLGGACSGYATSAPDFELSYTSGSFSLLRFYFESSGDTTLIINGPTGQWYCVDDSFGTLNPTIDFQNPSSGVYDIWVGSYASGELIPGVLYITEVSGNHP